MMFVGILCLGGLVGYLLAVAWKEVAAPKIKTAVALMGAAFTGVPIAFMHGLGNEKWLYPIGVVAGFFWSRVGKVLSIVAKGPTKAGKIAWYLAVTEALIISIATVLILFLGSRGLGPGSVVIEGAPITRAEMPCRLAWVYLGRYNNDKRRYDTPPGFRFLSDESHGAIPEVGDTIAITVERNLVVTGYGSTSSAKRCDEMLVPPAGYRPETASQYIAGQVSPGKRVLVNELAFFPSANANPMYVWALIGTPQ